MGDRCRGPVGRRLLAGLPAVAAISEVYGVELRVFGSVARGEDSPSSDLDLLVIGAVPGMLTTLTAHLHSALGVDIDLLPDGDHMATEFANVERDALPMDVWAGQARL